MADAFGEDLFNVFDEDSSSSRPIPQTEDEKSTQETDTRDDSQRYYTGVVIMSVANLVVNGHNSDVVEIRIYCFYSQIHS